MAAKIGGTDERRTKERIAHDVAIVLKADLHDKTKRIVVKNAAWVWTCDVGKYRGCTYWTQAAMDHYRSAAGGRKCEGLNHEHAVPIQTIFELLKRLPKFNQDSVYKCFEKYLQGVIITEEEHKRLNRDFKKSMPEEFNYQTGEVLARYRELGIEVRKPRKNWWQKAD